MSSRYVQIQLPLPLPPSQMEELYGAPDDKYHEIGEEPPRVIVIDLDMDDDIPF